MKHSFDINVFIHWVMRKTKKGWVMWPTKSNLPQETYQDIHKFSIPTIELVRESEPISTDKLRPLAHIFREGNSSIENDDLIYELLSGSPTWIREYWNTEVLEFSRILGEKDKPIYKLININNS